MATGRPASLVATCDQWLRATHESTAVEGVAGALTLSWEEPEEGPAPAGGESCPARGLATDRLCRIYRLTSDAVERLRVGPTAGGLDYGSLPDPIQLIGPTPAPAPGPDFTGPGTAPFGDPRGIAVDDNDRLFVSDAGRGAVSVIDLWSRRLLRTVQVASPATPAQRPAGLTSHGNEIYVALRGPAGLLRLTATRGPDALPLPAGADDLPAGSQPSRIAVLPGDGDAADRVVMLWHDSDGMGWLVAGARAPRRVGPASDIVVDAEGALVVAPCAGDPTLRRLVATPDGWTRTAPLDASGYDGGGLVLTRDGRIGYFTASGFRLAVRGVVTYRTEGQCTTYRLDSGVARNRWGRILVEACVPDATAVLVATATTDDEFETEIAHVAAEPAACLPVAPAATPPLPPDALAPVDDVGRPVHRRPGATTPWWRPPADTTVPYETFEAPSDAPEGRYLWVTIRLTGNGRRTPTVRELRVERQAHSLLRRLPQVYEAEEAQADFLHRYLAMFDGMLHDLDIRSACRDILVDPHASPVEALDWLASFFGLALDDRWAESARRQLVAEIVQLYRFRGTVWALGRYLEIFLAGSRAEELAGSTDQTVSPVIIEHFRLRGLGGPLLGADPTASSRSVLGAGFRVGGEVGSLDSTPLDPEEDATSAFESHAHRFTVLIPRPLSSEEEAAIRHVLDTERPAHTMYDLCTVDAGMRVGRGMHLGLSTIVGHTGAFESAVTDRSLLGRGAILGGPTTGTAVESARVGETTRVG